MTSVHGTAKRDDHTGALRSIAEEAFSLRVGEIQRLPGDVETNALVRGRLAGSETEQPYLLRLFTSGIDRAAVEFQRDLVDRAVGTDPELGPLLQTFVGSGPERIARVEFEGRTVDACLQRFLEGDLMADVQPHSPALLRDLGRVLGRLNVALADFGAAPPAATEDPSWRLLDAPDAIAHRLDDVEPGALRRGLVARIRDRYLEAVAPRLGELPTGFVHQDANENNVIVDQAASGARVSGLIDFGDATHTILAAEPAIAAAYAAFGKRDPLTAMGHVIAGYHAARPMADAEFEVVFDLALLRLAMSVTVSSARAASGHADSYHLVSQAPAWEALERLSGVHPRYAAAAFRDMAGLAPLPRAERFAAWADAQDFAPVMGHGLAGAPRVDLSVGSAFLTESGARDLPMAEWGARVMALQASSGAAAVIGHHDEARRLYESSAAFAEVREDGDEPRTIHLGVDLFAPAGTDVYAPLSGKVLSVQRNDAALDYGPTVILEHEGEAGEPFWTLYGHLDGEVLERLSPGDVVRRDESVARLGAESENGGWPPHLHFQMILDRLDAEGDFPGVAAPSVRRVWTALSPDPAPLLGLASCRADGRLAADLLAERRAWFCSSMSISYDEPLQMVKGRGTALFDAEGRAYLDAVNNVPHVGHCHPRVVRAGQHQMGLLNTNTRYLGEALVRYAEKLRARLPKHLEVIYFVSSGSEANEVALRLARAATDGARDVLVQEHGYHGHTGATVSRSHYKFAGPGGFDQPEDVHVVPLADPYRGPHRGPDSGPAYVRDVEEILERMKAAGRRPSAFLAEAIIGCGGQVVPPPGYLAAAFDTVRRFGGVTIADEVQVGFGRVGTHFWAFDEQGARPDIVTMGKPIGNAHPMAAVATTRAIAESFAGGMEFFATFGGNNVSAAIGEAVLDVIEDESLLENARQRGEQFFAGMAPLAAAHDVIGDVRGRGLYLGVDLIKDPATREPNAAAADYVAGRMKDRGILISTDGPFHNVLKIKPPIVFTESEMQRLIDTLGEIFRETPLSAG